jgi:Domain of unknown function (DUF4205)
MDVYGDIEMNDDLILPEDELILVSLAKALQLIISRASTSNFISIALETGSLPREVKSFQQFTWSIHQVPIGDECFEFLFNNISYFQSRTGCMLLLLSLIFTRGIRNVQNDMDMDSNTLVARFGHTTQELINLLLVGEATSNASDGHVTLGDSGLLLKGISHQSSIGYLTHLESLGLCQVGDYYKYPEYPIWVVGGTSHFSLMFSSDKSANERSTTAQLFTTLKRAFNEADFDSCGFIPMSKLQSVLIATNLPFAMQLANNPNDIERIQRHLQVDGDIIIWANFWATVSRLLSGDSLNDVTTS